MVTRVAGLKPLRSVANMGLEPDHLIVEIPVIRSKNSNRYSLPLEVAVVAQLLIKNSQNVGIKLGDRTTYWFEKNNSIINKNNYISRTSLCHARSRYRIRTSTIIKTRPWLTTTSAKPSIRYVWLSTRTCICRGCCS